MPELPEKGRFPLDESAGTANRKDRIARIEAWQACAGCETRSRRLRDSRGGAHCPGKDATHYATGQGGGLMLVFDRRAGERIRINATTEVVIFEVSQEHVRVAIRNFKAGRRSRHGLPRQEVKLGLKAG